MGLFDYLFPSDEKENALHELEVAQMRYESIGNRANANVQSLYKKRKDAVRMIERAESLLRKTGDLDLRCTRQIAEAKTSIRLFTEAIQNEADLKIHSNGTSAQQADASIADTTTGTVATLSPFATMAFATTFGTAATRTAISSLTGAAVTIGGGALATLGVGVTAASAILTMAGPVGIVLGGLALSKRASKDKEVTEQAKQMKREIYSTISRIERAMNDIKSTEDKISNDMSSLDQLLKGAIVDNATVYNYAEIVNIIVSLSQNIKKKFYI